MGFGEHVWIITPSLYVVQSPTSPYRDALEIATAAEDADMRYPSPNGEFRASFCHGLSPN